MSQRNVRVRECAVLLEMESESDGSRESGRGRDTRDLHVLLLHRYRCTERLITL
jgi:hypothetical protein